MHNSAHANAVAEEGESFSRRVTTHLLNNPQLCANKLKNAQSLSHQYAHFVIVKRAISASSWSSRRSGKKKAAAMKSSNSKCKKKCISK